MNLESIESNRHMLWGLFVQCIGTKWCLVRPTCRFSWSTRTYILRSSCNGVPLGDPLVITHEEAESQGGVVLGKITGHASLVKDLLALLDSVTE